MEKFLSEFEPQSFDDWLEEAQSSLRGKSIEKLYSMTSDGIIVKPIYTRKDIENLEFLRYEFPGLPKFIRGRNISGYKIKPWKIAQTFKTNSSEEFHSFLQSGIDNGVEAIVIEIFKDESSCKGLAFQTIDNFKKCFDGVNLSKLEFFIRTNLFPHTAFYFKEFLSLKNFDYSTLSGGFEFTPFNYFTKTGKLPIMDEIKNQIFNFFDWGRRTFPNFYSICVDGSIFKESGGNVVSEVAYVLSLAVEYLKIFASGNYNLKDFIGKMYFKFSFGSDFFLELSKIRAFRMLLSLILSRFAPELQYYQPVIYAITSRRNKSLLDYYTNILRNTTETLSAILSNVDYIETIPFDDPFGFSDEFAYRNARNTQNVLREEHNLLDTIDPISGSWYIESLSYEISKLSLELFKEIESIGGFYEAIKNGVIQSKISESFTNRLINLSIRNEILVGVNKYPQPIEFADKLEVNLESKAEPQYTTSTESLFSLRVDEAFDQENEIIKYATNGGNLFSIMLIQNFDCIDIKPLNEIREAEAFEKLYNKSNKFKEKFGHRPNALLLNFGEMENYRARADFSFDFLSVGGINVSYSTPSKEYEQLAKEFLKSSFEIAVICSSDELYPQFVPQISALIKKTKPLTVIVLSGLPKTLEQENLFRITGVDIFIHKGSNILYELDRIYQLLIT